MKIKKGVILSTIKNLQKGSYKDNPMLLSFIEYLMLIIKRNEKH